MGVPIERPSRSGLLVVALPLGAFLLTCSTLSESSPFSRLFGCGVLLWLVAIPIWFWRIAALKQRRLGTILPAVFVVNILVVGFDAPFYLAFRHSEAALHAFAAKTAVERPNPLQDDSTDYTTKLEKRRVVGLFQLTTSATVKDGVILSLEAQPYLWRSRRLYYSISGNPPKSRPLIDSRHIYGNWYRWRYTGW